MLALLNLQVSLQRGLQKSPSSHYYDTLFNCAGSTYLHLKFCCLIFCCCCCCLLVCYVPLFTLECEPHEGRGLPAYLIHYLSSAPVRGKCSGIRRKKQWVNIWVTQGHGTFALQYPLAIYCFGSVAGGGDRATCPEDECSLSNCGRAQDSVWASKHTRCGMRSWSFWILGPPLGDCSTCFLSPPQ